MNNIEVTQQRPNIAVRSELSEKENNELSRFLRLRGLKKGYFIRQAILEKLEREIKGDTE